MEKITYKMTLLSSLIVSPRGSCALYTDMDDFVVRPVIDDGDRSQKEVKVVYPFYQYGEYRKYDPVHAVYYLPGSSVKGAFQNPQKRVHFMSDDVIVPNKQVVLRNLYKVQKLEETKKATYEAFFPNVGIEMLRDGTELLGTLYMDNKKQFESLLLDANQQTRRKIKQMREYIQRLLSQKYPDSVLLILNHTEQDLAVQENKKDLILLGGYKGLLHSMVLDKNASGETGGLFIDDHTKRFHGLVRVDLQ